MAARSRFLPETRYDKKDDLTLTRSNTNSILGRWKLFRRRRVVLALVAVWLLYLFFKNMPTDVPPVSERYDRRYGRLRPEVPGQEEWQSQDERRDPTAETFLVETFLPCDSG